LSLSDNSLEAVLEPSIFHVSIVLWSIVVRNILNGLITLDLVVGTDGGLAAATLSNALSWSGHAAVEIHSVNSDRRVVLDTEIDVFADTETEVSSLREVTLAKLVLLDLQSTLQDLLSLWASDSDVNSDLLVTTDTESSDGVAGLACKLLICCRDASYGRSYCRQEFDH